jgi:hypothetical protein
VPFEPTMLASARLPTYALDRAATGIGSQSEGSKLKCRLGDRPSWQVRRALRHFLQENAVTDPYVTPWSLPSKFVPADYPNFILQFSSTQPETLTVSLNKKISTLC